MVRGALFRAFCSQNQIVPNKDNYLSRFGNVFRGGTVHISRFKTKGGPQEVKVWFKVN